MYTFTKVNPGTSTVEGENDAFQGILDQLKCPICMGIPSTEIFICKNGHSICGRCVEKVKNCPQCRVRLPVEGDLIRARVLESLLDVIMLPCPYKTEGCKELVSRKDEMGHVRCCKFNGHHVALCKQLGYNCDFMTNMLNAGAHFFSHKAVGPWALDSNNCITFYIDNFISAVNVYHGLKTNGIWTPVMLAEGDYHLMVVTFMNQADRTVSWICLNMRVPKPYEVEYVIGTLSLSSLGKVAPPPLQWKALPVSILNAEEFIKFPVLRVPVSLLEEHYLDKNGALKVKVTLSTLPSTTNSDGVAVNPIQQGGSITQDGQIRISHVTPRHQS